MFTLWTYRFWNIFFSNYIICDCIPEHIIYNAGYLNEATSSEECDVLVHIMVMESNCLDLNEEENSFEAYYTDTDSCKGNIYF
jgi:hypothetical protein